MDALLNILVRLLVSLGGLAAAGFLGYIFFVTPRRLVLERLDIALGNGRIAPPIRLLHLSDFHATTFGSLRLIERAIDVGLAEQPDLICVTGDFITWRLHHVERYRALLARLPAAAPTFAVLGNHDGGSWSGGRFGYRDPEAVLALLRESGVVCLRDEARLVAIAGRPLRIIGLSDYYAGLKPDAAIFARNEHGGAPAVVLAHNPDAKADVADFEWDLLLAGHTHGGYLRLPLLGAPWAPVKDKRRLSGLHRWRERRLYISQGVGSFHTPRLNTTPQVTLLRLL
jgi:hypothetical protein